ncbi:MULTISPECIES: ArsR/SmtB family transcription factor [unclassified Pseudoclavibacter]|uniref:ArsR/SmtB family transcription factor n=1 Tax=unclassified Pseudoclavibacter TaxID=2615177 RepID=UPI000CE84F5B|nr:MULTISPECIES: metalloregulator ArsR/SmtB family transcription factor [unclassified Pseudoclavibacter]MBS3179624.1 winged helix-turn-helix transcriptional regulator [Pseudoclavibacter sp. Marseille-Q4354]PPG30561.1 transcriptional regulator [Pseudoclavibacter sp. RFBB5]
MVTRQLSEDDVSRIFQALADATRRDILTRVLREEQSVTSLAEAYAMSFAAVQKHVAVLTRAGLTQKRKQGREQLVQADSATIARATRLLESYEQLWRDRSSRIDDLLADDDQTGTPTARADAGEQ